MLSLTEQGQRLVAELAQRYGFSTEAVASLLRAVAAGNGTMAQFDHPELGGAGQWMLGGMTMVGDMFNHALKAKIDALCSELSRHLASQPLTASQQPRPEGGGPLLASGPWWPAELGTPSASGAQDGIRYAVFPGARRLAVEVGGRVAVYDTLDHRISGIAQQQQGSGASLSFASQHGPVPLDQLPRVGGDPTAPPAPAETDPYAALERLAELQRKGILSDEEFAQKKAELLGRI
ncbi:SHOCT domain-containing protein [Candidatus Methylocalor cossyra]|uniref:SHOCT domain-containing protein n=1 Tax=Candidatus Methylocalor cossyra TaxID=3108543 RepID=A0ABM9NHI6_9GAMM